AFLAFLGGSTLLARAEQRFGPPAPQLSSLQALRLGLELGWRAEALRPLDPAAAPVRFTIAAGEPTGQLVARLQAEGLIRDAALFSSYLVYSGRDTQLQSGSFELSAAMSGDALAAALL